MKARQFLALRTVMVLGITMGVMSTSAQDLIIDHFDGTATTLTWHRSRSRELGGDRKMRSSQPGSTRSTVVCQRC